MGRCELTHLERHEIDVDRAAAEHDRYEALLRELGCEVRSLPAAPDLPDSVFVEDAAIVLDELAIITRPGAESRRCEIPAIAAALALHRQMAQIVVPGALEGGDVLVIDRKVYTGMSSRTNSCGIRQLADFLRPYSYAIVPVPVSACLHLKSAVTRVAADSLLINRHWVHPDAFPRAMRRIDVDPEEPFAANALWIDDRVIYPAAFPRTMERLRAAGIDVAPIDVSEIAKAEGGVTCCSLVFEG